MYNHYHFFLWNFQFFFLDDNIRQILVDSHQLTYTLNENLTHFTTYNIELYVCRELYIGEDRDSRPDNCSVQKAMTTAKTKKKGNISYFYRY